MSILSIVASSRNDSNSAESTNRPSLTTASTYYFPLEPFEIEKQRRTAEVVWKTNPYVGLVVDGLDLCPSCQQKNNLRRMSSSQLTNLHPPLVTTPSGNRARRSLQLTPIAELDYSSSLKANRYNSLDSMDNTPQDKGGFYNTPGQTANPPLAQTPLENRIPKGAASPELPGPSDGSRRVSNSTQTPFMTPILKDNRTDLKTAPSTDIPAHRQGNAAAPRVAPRPTVATKTQPIRPKTNNYTAAAPIQQPSVKAAETDEERSPDSRTTTAPPSVPSAGSPVPVASRDVGLSAKRSSSTASNSSTDTKNSVPVRRTSEGKPPLPKPTEAKSAQPTAAATAASPKANNAYPTEAAAAKVLSRAVPLIPTTNPKDNNKTDTVKEESKPAATSVPVKADAKPRATPKLVTGPAATTSKPKNAYPSEEAPKTNTTAARKPAPPSKTSEAPKKKRRSSASLNSSRTNLVPNVILEDDPKITSSYAAANRAASAPRARNIPSQRSSVVNTPIARRSTSATPTPRRVKRDMAEADPEKPAEDRKVAAEYRLDPNKFRRGSSVSGRRSNNSDNSRRPSGAFTSDDDFNRSINRANWSTTGSTDGAEEEPLTLAERRMRASQLGRSASKVLDSLNQSRNLEDDDRVLANTSNSVTVTDYSPEYVDKVRRQNETYGYNKPAIRTRSVVDDEEDIVASVNRKGKSTGKK